MILKIYFIGLMVIILGLFIVFGLIIYDIKRGKYKVNDSILMQEAETKYGILYPDKSIDDLKNEIEKVAELLIAGEESNRYTELLRRKAQKDVRVQELKDAIVENVELVKYVGDVLKARIKYKDYDYEYALILSFSTVTAGRVFLNSYFIFKNKMIMKEVS